MRKYICRRGLAVILGLALAVHTPLGSWFSPAMVSFGYTERSAKVNASSLNVRSGPGTSNSIVAKVTQGTAVTVIGEQTASDGALWYQIRFTTSSGAQTTGFVSGGYLRFPISYSMDSDFEAYLNSEGFPESYKEELRQLHAQHPQWVFRAQHTGLDWNTVIENEAKVGRNLVAKQSVSSWKSTADGAYNWDTGTWPGFDGSSWVAASEDIVRYYMDPRNFLDDTYVFQFLLQSYDGSVQTAGGLQSLIQGTFLSGEASNVSGNTGGITGGGGPLAPGGGQGTGNADINYGPGMNLGGQSQSGSGNVPGNQGSGSSDGSGPVIDYSAPTKGSGTDDIFRSPQASVSRHEAPRVSTSYGPGMGTTPGVSPGGGAPSPGSGSYVDIIMNAGAQSGVNPYVLAAMIVQEQGNSGASGSISGSETGYEGYYNFFNIEAYQSGSLSAVQRGLWWASQPGSYGRPWNSVDRAIMGGAVYYGDNYVKAGQDTFYLKKFNVQGSNLYKHQYMTNVQAAASEGAKLAQAYSADLKNTALEFKIPVYTNMPDSACVKPSLDGSPNNKLSGLGVLGFAITPTFSKDTLSYDLIVDNSVANVTVEAAAIDSAATVSGTGGIQLESGVNEIKVSVRAQNGTIREYVIHVVRQAGGPTYTEGVGGAGSSGGPAAPANTGSPGGQDSSTGPGAVVSPGGAVTVTPLGDAAQNGNPWRKRYFSC